MAAHQKLEWLHSVPGDETTLRQGELPNRGGHENSFEPLSVGTLSFYGHGDGSVIMCPESALDQVHALKSGDGKEAMVFTIPDGEDEAMIKMIHCRAAFLL